MGERIMWEKGYTGTSNSHFSFEAGNEGLPRRFDRRMKHTVTVGQPRGGAVPA